MQALTWFQANSKNCKTLHIDHTISFSYNHSSDVQVEASINFVQRTIKSVLKLMLV